MNIFYIDTDPYKAAELMVDRHVVKMILESAQLLSTAHRLLDGKMKVILSDTGRKKKIWELPDERNSGVYHATHVNHPSAVWARQSRQNYNWLYNHFCGLMNEYTYRYGKVHACAKMVPFLRNAPFNIALTPFTEPTVAMDDKYIIGESSLENYRNYYKAGKTHLHKWTKREAPEWIDNP